MRFFFFLDVGLPDEDGLTVAKHLRTLTDAGIVMLTGRRRKKFDHIRSLDEGADVYVTKPIDIDVLTAIVRSVLRRLEQPKIRGLNGGSKREMPPGWNFDGDSWNLASPGGESVRLTRAERLVVSLLSASPGEAVARDTIISRLSQGVHDFDPHRPDTNLGPISEAGPDPNGHPLRVEESRHLTIAGCLCANQCAQIAHAALQPTEYY